MKVIASYFLTLWKCLIFCLKTIIYLLKLTANIFHHFVGAGRLKKFEVVELQFVLDKDNIISQKQMTNIIQMTQKTISESFHAIGKNQKEEK